MTIHYTPVKFTISLIQRLGLLFFGILLSTVTGFAQKSSTPAPAIKFGKITTDQFTLLTADSTAEAVVLYDFGEVLFDRNDSDLWLNSTYHVRIYIRKKSAYDRATIQLPTRRGTSGQHEYISEFEGYTYNLVSGVITTDRLGSTGHFTEKASDQFWIEKYTLPNIREGSIIEYQYTVRTPFSVAYNPRTWRFQQDIPVNWSEYRIAIPDYSITKC